MLVLAASQSCPKDGLQHAPAGGPRHGVMLQDDGRCARVVVAGGVGDAVLPSLRNRSVDPNTPLFRDALI